jgi:hypothetical protein
MKQKRPSRNANKNNKLPAKNKGGRPTKYKPEFNEMAYELCKWGGLDDKKLAKVFKTTETTITTWKHKYPEFLLSLKQGKIEFDTDNVENALLQRALGYHHREVQYFSHNGIVTDQRITTKQYPPETGACIKWLMNRRGKDWSEKDQEKDPPIQQTINVYNLPVDDIRNIRDIVGRANQKSLEHTMSKGFYRAGLGGGGAIQPFHTRLAHRCHNRPPRSSLPQRNQQAHNQHSPKAYEILIGGSILACLGMGQAPWVQVPLYLLWGEAGLEG